MKKLTGQWPAARDSRPSSDQLVGLLTLSIILIDRHRGTAREDGKLEVPARACKIARVRATVSEQLRNYPRIEG